MVHLLLIHLFKYPGLTYLVVCGAHWIVSELVKADVQQVLPAGSRSQIQLVVTVVLVHHNKRWYILLKIVQWQDSRAVFRLYILLMRMHSFDTQSKRSRKKERKNMEWYPVIVHKTKSSSGGGGSSDFSCFNSSFEKVNYLKAINGHQHRWWFLCVCVYQQVTHSSLTSVWSTKLHWSVNFPWSLRYVGYEHFAVCIKCSNRGHCL